MVQKVKMALANKIKEIFLNEKVYIEKIRQGVSFPCFYLSMITTTKKKLAYIDYMQSVSIDIQYLVDVNKNDNNKLFSDVIEKLNSISKIEIDNVKNIEVEVESIDIVDDVLHYQIVLNIPLQNINIKKSKNKTYSIIQELLENISSKKVYYINGDLNELKNSFFVIEPNYLETKTVSITGLKEYDRIIQIRYVTTDLQQDIPDYLENIMDKLLFELRKISGLKSFNYNIDIEYNGEEFNELNVLSHEIELHLLERKI